MRIVNSYLRRSSILKQSRYSGLEVNRIPKWLADETIVTFLSRNRQLLQLLSFLRRLLSHSTASRLTLMTNQELISEPARWLDHRKRWKPKGVQCDVTESVSQLIGIVYMLLFWLLVNADTHGRFSGFRTQRFTSVCQEAFRNERA